MNSTLQDIMGLLNHRMTKVPTDKDYMVIAGHATRGVLTPQPKLQPSVITLGSLKEYILSSTTLSTTLNTVLTAGNTSLLDAKIGDLYLFDVFDDEYGKIRLSDSSLYIFNSSGTSMFSVDGGILSLNNGNATANISNSLTTARNYALPNQSGTFALTSDLTAYVPYIGSSGQSQILIGTAVGGQPAFGLMPQLTVAASSTEAVLDIRNTNSTIGINTLIGRLQFTGKDDQTVGYAVAAIDVVTAGSAGTGSGGGGILKFMTAFNSAASSPGERMRIDESGFVGINNTSLNSVDRLQVTGNVLATQYKISALNTAPATSTSTGILGEVRITATHIYVCSATNTWVRTALTTF